MTLSPLRPLSEAPSSVRLRLILALLLVAAEGFSAVVATTALERSISIFVVVIGGFMVLDAVRRLGAPRD